MNSLHKNIYDPLTGKFSGLQLSNDSIRCRAIMQQEVDSDQILEQFNSSDKDEKQ